jgi:hypothetical protein
MDLNDIKPVKINQSGFYPYEIKLKNKGEKSTIYSEPLMGCPQKCFFCHFTWARKHINTGKYNHSAKNGSQELDMFNIDQYNPNVAKLTIGLDGIDEELRYFANKRISNVFFENFLIDISHKTQITGKALFLQLYNITGYEIENDLHYYNFKAILEKVKSKLKKRIILILHSTPLHPSPCTPLAYSKVDLNSKINTYKGLIVPEHEKLYPVFSQFQESGYALFESLVVERGTEFTQDIFNDVVFNPKLKSLKSKDKLKAIQYKHDVNSLIREYSIEEELPTWFLESYTPNEKIKKLRTQMLKKTKLR